MSKPATRPLGPHIDALKKRLKEQFVVSSDPPQFTGEERVVSNPCKDIEYNMTEEEKKLRGLL